MKNILLILSLFVGLVAQADCSSNGLSIFPYNQNIKKNSIFILDGYAQSQEVILSLNTKYPIYLKSKKKKVLLAVKEICIGQMSVTQAVLYPVEELEVGETYTVCIDSLAELPLTRYNSKTSKYDPVTYTILDESDFISPIFVFYPKETEKAYTPFGCGPAIYVIFDYFVTDSSEVKVKTTVKNLTTETETTYYISANQGKIQIGHGMCSGPFKFEEGEKYEVEFALMDASGNMLNWERERIPFVSPTEKDWK